MKKALGAAVLLAVGWGALLAATLALVNYGEALPGAFQFILGCFLVTILTALVMVTGKLSWEAVLDPAFKALKEKPKASSPPARRNDYPDGWWPMASYHLGDLSCGPAEVLEVTWTAHSGGRGRTLIRFSPDGVNTIRVSPKTEMQVLGTYFEGGGV